MKLLKQFINSNSSSKQEKKEDENESNTHNDAASTNYEEKEQMDLLKQLLTSNVIYSDSQAYRWDTTTK